MLARNHLVGHAFTERTFFRVPNSTSMLYAIGTKVVFKHTGDTGVVRSKLADNMLGVYVAELDMEIPAHQDDLRSLIDTVAVPEPQDRPAPAPRVADPMLQYGVLQPWGIQLAFEALDQPTTQYAVYLINDTRHEAIYDFELLLQDRPAIAEGGRLSVHSYERLGTIYADDLNRSPKVVVKVWRSTTAGREQEQEKSMRLKAKQFFRNVKTAPILNRRVHLYQLFESLDRPEEKPATDLRDYTKKAAPNRRTTRTMAWQSVDVKEFAAFNNELDLHISNLVPDVKKLDKRKILAVQLKAFDDFMDEAIRLGVDRVFIIHGVGKGKLRDHVATRLFQLPEVKRFINEFHPKYGFGATEVEL